MKAQIRVSGTDGQDHYERDAVVERDSEWLRRLLVNGLAEPQDDQATAICTTPAQVERYRSETYYSKAVKKGVPNQQIPALAGN
jgi:hypothetical protein